MPQETCKVAFFIYSGVVLVGLLLPALYVIFCAHKAVSKGTEHQEALGRLFERSNAVRLLTVGSIVLVAAVLALAKALDTSVLTLLSGIAGYVLGGASSSGQPKTPPNGSEASSPKPRPPPPTNTPE